MIWLSCYASTTVKHNDCHNLYRVSCRVGAWISPTTSLHTSQQQETQTNKNQEGRRRYDARFPMDLSTLVFRIVIVALFVNSQYVVSSITRQRRAVQWFRKVFDCRNVTVTRHDYTQL